MDKENILPNPNHLSFEYYSAPVNRVFYCLFAFDEIKKPFIFYGFKLFKFVWLFFLLIR
jgi:hypothetical protein